MSRRGAINKAISGRHSVNGSASVRSESSPSLSSINVPLSLEDHAGAVGESPSPISAVASLGSAAESALPEMLDPQKIYKAFLEAQKKIAGLEEENKKLTALNLDLNLAAAVSRRNRANIAKKGSQTSGTGETTGSECAQLLDLVRNTMKLGQHHQLFWCVILDVSQFSRENCPDWGWDDFNTRYSSAQLQKQGPTAELYAAIPDEYHDLMALSTTSDSGKNFVKHFRAAMSQSRSSSLATLRAYSTLIFDCYGLAAEFFESKYDREQVPEIRRLLGCTVADPVKNTFNYARFPPILCEGDDPETINKRFLNPVLFRVARAVIFGKAAIKSTTAAVGRASSMYLRPDKYAKTTVGLIAWVAMMTRYILSKDNAFDQSGVGNLTKTPYYSDYDFYKHWILRAEAQNSAWATTLFTRWDVEVFSQHNKSAGSTPDDEGETIRLDDADEIARDMDALDVNDSLSNDQSQSVKAGMHASTGSILEDDYDDIYDDIYEPINEPVNEPVQTNPGAETGAHSNNTNGGATTDNEAHEIDDQEAVHPADIQNQNPADAPAVPVTVAKAPRATRSRAKQSKDEAPAPNTVKTSGPPKPRRNVKKKTT